MAFDLLMYLLCRKWSPQPTVLPSWDIPLIQGPYILELCKTEYLLSTLGAMSYYLSNYQSTALFIWRNQL